MNSKSWKDLQLKESSAAAIGNFDGVHLGHQKIIQDLKEVAQKYSLEPVILTFSPHPEHYFKRQPLSLLTTPMEKLEWIREYGVQNIQVLSFDESLACLEPDEFIQEILVKRLKCRRVFLGPNHKFGKGGKGNTQYLQSSILEGRPEVHIIQPYEFEDKILSSTLIREEIANGNLEKGVQMMGHPFLYTGTVVPGEGRGRKLGFPTANLDIQSDWKLLLPKGVYGGFLRNFGEKRPIIVNIGNSPTFGGKMHKIEVHILNFDQDIYDKTVTIELNCYIRNEIEFKNVQQLMDQIQVDINNYTKKLERKATLS